MVILATHTKKKQEMGKVQNEKYAVKKSSHPKWITADWKSGALLYLNSLLQPESKLEREWAVWLERPWADSRASVFGCTWQDNSVVSQGLWRTHSQILYTPPNTHKICLLPSYLGFPSQLRALRPNSTTLTVQHRFNCLHVFSWLS